ncbi:MAG: extracellular solute-binding protein [Sphaerochaetaceae bacterium]|nr:extracellular solute-binding protein [Sphaerochaetaceae bacterium]MDC7250004.1 extracellular solute-binding protein [Sphaerochaetaceae bacterium]
MKKLLLFLCIMLSLTSAFAQGSSEKNADETIVLKMGDNVPDRKNGLGLVIETINTEFEQTYPNVTITTESYNDQPWQEKVRIYATANQLPDVFRYWSFSTLLTPLVEAGMIEELDYEVYSQYEFLPGALEGNMIDGKLYGIPTSSDLWVIYYNKSLFEKAGVEIPTSWDDIMESADAFNDMGIIPMVTDGKDGWPLCELFDNMAQRINGDFTYVAKAQEREMKYTDESFVKTADYIQELVKAGVFQENLTTSDYGDARNAFGQERAAMYMMGSWEMGLANDTNFSENFKENLDVMPFPVVEGGKGKATDTLGWYGGNIVISSNSKIKDVANNYVEKIASDFGQKCWDLQAAFPPVKVQPLETDTHVAKQLLSIAANATTMSGTPGLDRLDNVFKEDHQELMRQLCSLIIDSEEFTTKLDASAQRAYDER